MLDALASSQRLGLLGARPVEEVVEHAGAFVDALVTTHGRVLDLGSGGGVPGLVIARARPDLRVLLVDRRTARTDHLRRLVHRLGLQDRVDVLTVDAAQLPSVVAAADAVVARGFGPPPTVMAAARPVLVPSGRLVVSAPPPGATERWSADELARGGFRRLDHPDARVVVLATVPRETFNDPEVGGST